MIKADPVNPIMKVFMRYQEYPDGPWTEVEMKEENEVVKGLKTEVYKCPKYQTKD